MQWLVLKCNFEGARSGVEWYCGNALKTHKLIYGWRLDIERAIRWPATWCVQYMTMYWWQVARTVCIWLSQVSDGSDRTLWAALSIELFHHPCLSKFMCLSVWTKLKQQKQWKEPRPGCARLGIQMYCILSVANAFAHPQQKDASKLTLWDLCLLLCPAP